MPAIDSKQEIREILNSDRAWSLYALADLDDAFFANCRWYAPTGGTRTLVLLYGGFDPPVIFAMGEAEAVARLLDEFHAPHEMYLHIPVHLHALMRRRCVVRNEMLMWRMMLKPDLPQEVCADSVVRLDGRDLPALQRLYVDGDLTAESPDFFDEAMVERGVYFGVHDGDDLIAVAGTHVVSRDESAAAIGNVYTRRDRRGRGLATATTSSVARELLRMNIRTIGLNVAQDNDSAVRVYERIGFVRYCPFVEGIAVRHPPA